MGSSLDKPISEAHLVPGKGIPDLVGNNLKAGLASMQGKRTEMEDAHCVEMAIPGKPSYSFFAVFDGHAGSLVAKRSAQAEGGLLSKIMAQPSWAEVDHPAHGPDRLKDAITQGFIAHDQALRSEELAHYFQEDNSGCTAVCAIVTPSHIVLANCGDARALLVSTEGGVVFATEDHKPYSGAEKVRIEAAGSAVSYKRVVNGEMSLAVSRALGDFSFKQFKQKGSSDLAPPEQQPVSCVPDVTVLKRADMHAFLVLCCDGIFDVLTSSLVAKSVVDWSRSKMVETPGPCHPQSSSSSPCHGTADLAYGIIQKAMFEQSTDNMSALVVALPPAPGFGMAAGALSEGERA